MGFWDNILRPAWRVFRPNVQYLNTVQEVVEELFDEEGMSVSNLWKKQPHLRTVVGFLARNVAHVGLHLYQRVDENDRRRVRDGVGAALLRRPNSELSMFDLLFALEADKKLYDRAYWWLRPTSDAPAGVQILRLPPAWVNPIPENRWEIKNYEVVNEKGNTVEVPRDQVLSFTGYSPTDPLAGSATVIALRDILKEQMEAALYRTQVWKRGGRVSAVLERPLGAKWSPGARDSFREDWYQKWTGRGGEKAGGTPILEDGMTLHRIDFNPRENQFVEANKLAMATVASAYHTPPSMVGVMEGANYSVVKEFRQMLYTETLGPDFEDIQQRLNGFFLEMLGLDPEEYYFEFNIQRKLQGSFEEQASLLSTSVGRPWMTANEARGRWNMPQIEGGDQLVTPLNVLIGGQASPQDGQSTGGQGTQEQLAGASAMTADEINKRISAAATLIRSGFDPQAALEAVGFDPIDHLGLLPVTVQKPETPAGEVDEDLVDEISSSDGQKDASDGTAARPWGLYRVKEDEDVTASSRDQELVNYELKHQEIVTGFFRRQRAAVSSRFKAGVDDWWDEERWNTELGHDLAAWNVFVASELGRKLLKEHGFDPDDLDPSIMEAWLTEVGRGSAANINASTKQRLDEELAKEEPSKDVLDAVFGDGRALLLAIAALTTIAAFARQEAGKQTGAKTKTWLAGSNPRDTHLAMSGETVGIRDLFSNGMKWPGDPGGGVEDLAGCNCSLLINWEE